MGFIAEIELSKATLIAFMALPFLYYGYQARFWYLPDRLKLLDFLLSTAGVGLSIIVMIRLVFAAREKDFDQVQFALLHLGPIVLALMAMSRDRKRGQTGAGTGAPARAMAVGEEKPAAQGGFQPAARNDEVEALTWDDVIVSEETKEELNSVVTLLKNPDLAKDYGIALPKGILFNGPPGTGKTTIAKVVANMAGLSFFVLRANEIVSKWVGESEKNLTKLFEAAQEAAPAVIFVDEIDSLGKKRAEGNAAHSDNLLNHLLQLIDGVLKSDGVYIIAATNRADLVDDALKRAGRLNRVIEIPAPDLEGRRKLFSLYLKKLKLADDVDPELLAESTTGCSAADIKAICSQAGMNAFQREQPLPEKFKTHQVTSADLEASLELFVADEDELEAKEQKSNKDGTPQPLNDAVEKVSWSDVIIDEELKSELQSVVTLLKDPQTATRYGITVPKGILLNGPPGTGKTTLAKIIANEAGLAFFALRIDEIVSKWVGESEKNLTKLFKAAAKHAPSIIFIDEVDSIAKNRAEGNAQHADNLLNHLLQLMDGVIKREGVYIIAATNRADLVDPALKRGGRLNKTIQVNHPGPEARAKLFQLYLDRLPLAGRVDFAALASLTENQSAADIREICNQAGLNAFKRESGSGSREYRVTGQDLEVAIRDWAASR